MLHWQQILNLRCHISHRFATNVDCEVLLSFSFVSLSRLRFQKCLLRLEVFKTTYGFKLFKPAQVWVLSESVLFAWVEVWIHVALALCVDVLRQGFCDSLPCKGVFRAPWRSAHPGVFFMSCLVFIRVHLVSVDRWNLLIDGQDRLGLRWLERPHVALKVRANTISLGGDVAQIGGTAQYFHSLGLWKLVLLTAKRLHFSITIGCSLMNAVNLSSKLESSWIGSPLRISQPWLHSIVLGRQRSIQLPSVFQMVDSPLCKEAIFPVSTPVVFHIWNFKDDLEDFCA